jgi:hypothetical protein
MGDRADPHPDRFGQVGGDPQPAGAQQGYAAGCPFVKELAGAVQAKDGRMHGQPSEAKEGETSSISGCPDYGSFDDPAAQTRPQVLKRPGIFVTLDMFARVF